MSLHVVQSLTPWARARNGEPRLGLIEQMVDAVVAHVRPEDSFNGDQFYVWSVKPLVFDLVGYGRRGRNAQDEDWLRSSEAWDAVQRHLVDLVAQAGERRAS